MGWYQAASHGSVPCRFTVNSESFGASVGAAEGSGATGSTAQREWGQVECAGTFLLVNTIEAFKQADKQRLLDAEAARVWAAIRDGSAVADPRLVARFLLLSFADLKKHRCVRGASLWSQASPKPARPPVAVTLPVAPRTACTPLALWR